MNIDLKNKTALITGGAGKGLGRADCFALGKAGCNIAIFDIADLSETVSLLEKEGIKAKGYKVDISDMNQVSQAVNQIVQDFGGIDILVNNASILNTVGMFADIPVDRWNRDLSVNLAGSANVTRAVWPHLLQRKWGRVVFISSIAGTRGGAGQSSYAATKAGVIGLTKTLALEGARFNITVNAVAPGVMESDAAVTMIRPDMLDRMRKKVPSQKLGKVEDIANTVTFLCSEQANYITGQVLEVDGGMGLFVF